MLKQHLYHVEETLTTLAETFGCRPTGSEANSATCHWIKQRFLEGLPKAGHREIRLVPLKALGWTPRSTALIIDGQPVNALLNPYSPSFKLSGQGHLLRNQDELDAFSIPNSVLILTDDLTAETVMPKNYPFYNPEHHQKMVQRLCALSPSLVIAIKDTALPDSLTGADKKSFLEPLFNDGDLNFPSITLTKVDFESVCAPSSTYHVEAEACADLAERASANIVATLGAQNGPRVLIIAHYDTFFNTPGALDNASGIAFLDLALRLMAERQERGVLLTHTFEFVAINGEDHYAFPGEQAILDELAAKGPHHNIKCVVNIDGLGYKGTKVGLSHYAMPSDLHKQIDASIELQPKTEWMPPWPQSDHSIFAMAGIPAIAITSSPLDDYMNNCHHAPIDLPDQVDTELIVEGVNWFLDFVDTLECSLENSNPKTML